MLTSTTSHSNDVRNLPCWLKVNFLFDRVFIHVINFPEKLKNSIFEIWIIPQTSSSSTTREPPARSLWFCTVSFFINSYYNFLHIFTCVSNLLKLTPLGEKKGELDLLASKWRNSITGRVVENYWMFYNFWRRRITVQIQILIWNTLM